MWFVARRTPQRDQRYCDEVQRGHGPPDVPDHHEISATPHVLRPPCSPPPSCLCDDSSNSGQCPLPNRPGRWLDRRGAVHHGGRRRSLQRGDRVARHGTRIGRRRLAPAGGPAGASVVAARRRTRRLDRADFRYTPGFRAGRLVCGRRGDCGSAGRLARRRNVATRPRGTQPKHGGRDDGTGRRLPGSLRRRIRRGAAAYLRH